MANVTRSALSATSSLNFPDNTSQLISPLDLRDWISDGIDSFVTQKDVSTFENAFYECKGSVVTASATTDLGLASGNFLHITGTPPVTITSFGTVSAGARFVICFDVAVTISYNGTSLIIPGASNITTTAGDCMMLISEGSGNWRVVGYFPGTGLPVGTVTAVTASSPISSTGGNAPNLSIPQATGSVDGYLSSSDWTTFNNKGNGTVTSVGASAPLSSTGGNAPDISITQADSTTDGYLSSTDWNTFDGKQDALTLTTSGTSGAATLVGSTLNIPQYSGGTGGITALTGDVTASGTGSVAATIANSAVDIPMLSATGTPSATTFLRGDNVWATPAGASPTGYYAMYQDLVTQTAAASNTGYPMKFRTMDLSNQVTVVSDTRITFTNAGIYNLQFSSQFQNTDNAQHDITIWLRLNGTDVSGSAGFVQIPARKGAGAGNEGHLITSWNYLLDVAAGQYYEIVWSTTNAANVTMQFYAAGSPPPSTASTLFTVTQQAGIMAGTGITGMVGTTGPTQTGATQTLSSSDMTITSSGNTHTFAIPDASASTKGLITTSAQTLAGIKTFGNGTSAGEIRLLEGSGGGTNYTGIKASATLASDYSLVLPSTAPGTGQALVSDGSGNLSWSSNPGTTGAKFLSTVSASTVTGTTAETLLQQLLIPANTFSVGDTIKLIIRARRQTQLATDTWKFYISNVASTFSGKPQVGYFTIANIVQFGFTVERHITIYNSTTTYYINSATSRYTDFNNDNLSSSNIDWTVDQYIITTVAPATVGQQIFSVNTNASPS